MRLTWHLILFFTLFCVGSSYAQVERIGMKGTAYFSIIGELGKTLYATSGDGLNCYRSTDEGDTWSLFIDGLPVNNRSYGFKIMGNTIYSQSAQGEYQATELSNSWTFYKYPLVIDSVPNYIYRKDKDTLYTILSFGDISKDGFYYSSDNGITWQRSGITIKYLFDQILISGNRVLLPSYSINDTTTHFGIIKSDDNGKTWQNSSAGLPDSAIVKGFQNIYGNIFAWVSNTSGTHLYKSNNRGDDWSIVYQLKDSNWAVTNIFEHNGKIYLLSVQSYPLKARSLFLSEDTGKTWFLYYLDTASTVNINSFFATDNRIFAERRKKNFLISKDGQAIPFSAKDGLYQPMTILYAGESNMFAIAPGDSLNVSDDNGMTWHSQFFIKNQYCYGPFIKRNGSLYSFGRDLIDSSHNIYCSSDDGKTWTTYARIPIKKALNFIDVQGDTIIADFTLFYYWLGDVHYVSIDKGKSWVSIDANYPGLGRNTGGDPGDRIYIHDGKLYTLFMGHAAFNICHSYDLGTTWDSFPGPQKYSIGDQLKMTFSNNSFYVFAHEDEPGVSRSNILRSSDDGFSWINPKVGLPDSSLFGSSIEFGNIFYAATTKNGFCSIYFSLDSGLTWRQNLEPILAGTDLFANSKYIFISKGDHLYRTPLQNLSVPLHQNITSRLLNLDLISPNPANEVVTVHFIIYEPVNKITLNLFNESGNLCSSFVLPSIQGENNFKFDTRKFSSGSYILSSTNGNYESRQKLDIIH